MAKGKRREKGDGSLYPRKNRAGKVIGWFGAYNAEDGKRRRVYAKTREEAKSLMTRTIADAEAGVLPYDREPDMEVAEYLASWLTGCQASLKVTSYRRYETPSRSTSRPRSGAQGSRSSPPQTFRASIKRRSGMGFLPSR